MMIWGHKKAGIQMEPKSRKDAWIQEKGCASQKMKTKTVSSQITDPHYHAAALRLWEELLRAVNLSQ